MSASLSPSPRLRFFGTDGAPLAGGFLITYDNEDSQPVATYNDAGMAAENPAQLPLDANGEPSYEGIPRNVFLENGKFYKFKWFDKDGNLVGSCDNIGASGRGGGSGNAIVRGVENEGIKVSSMIDSSGNTVYIVALTEDVLTVLATAYIVPNGGIPKTDLAQGVKDSLELADSSLQPGDLDKVVRVNAEQNFTDSEKAQAQKNISAAEYRGNQFDIVQNHDGTGKYCKIAELIREGHRKDYCYYYFTLCIKFVVNFDASTLDGIENGTFLFSAVDYDRLNVYNDNGQWIDYDNAFKYDGISQCIKGVHILRQKTGLKVDRYEIWLEVDDTIFNVAGSISVNVLSDVGSWAYNGQSSRSDRGMKAGWFKVYDATQEGQPMLLTGTLDTLTNSTFVEAVRKPQLAVLDTPYYTQADGDNAVKRGDLPVIVDQSGEGATAFPIALTDSAQKFASINAVRRMSVFNGGPSGNILYLARFCSMGFMTPTIDTSTAGLYLVGEDYLYPMAGQTHSISVYLEVVDPGSSVYNVMATWRRSGTDDPKEFKIAVTYFGNTVGCWHGTKTLSTTETALVITDFYNMVKMEIDFISTDGERWYHFEYVKEANRSRMVEY